MTGKLAGRLARYFHSPVASEPKRPPSGVWLSEPSGGFDAADATRQNTSLLVVASWQTFWNFKHGSVHLCGHVACISLTLL